MCKFVIKTNIGVGVIFNSDFIFYTYLIQNRMKIGFCDVFMHLYCKKYLHCCWYVLLGEIIVTLCNTLITSVVDLFVLTENYTDLWINCYGHTNVFFFNYSFSLHVHVYVQVHVFLEMLDNLRIWIDSEEVVYTGMWLTACDS